jgi:hypothetical protein
MKARVAAILLCVLALSRGARHSRSMTQGWSTPRGLLTLTGGGRREERRRMRVRAMRGASTRD